MRRAALAAILAVAVGAAVVTRSDGRMTVHVSGDWPGALDPPVERAPLDEARVRVLLMSSWGKLRHVEGAAALCGARCEARPGPRVVRVISLRAPRVTKDVLIRLDWDGSDAPDAEETACAAAVIAAEAAALRPDPPCWEAVTRWRLPFGLGVWG